MTTSSTPAAVQPANGNGGRRSRPTTPLRRVSRPTTPTLPTSSDPSLPPLAFLSTSIAELADGLNDVQTNMEQLNLIHESLTSFNEAFASFLYGMKMNAFCVEWPEAPILESFEGAKDRLLAHGLARGTLQKNPFQVASNGTYDESAAYHDRPSSYDDDTTPKGRRHYQNGIKEGHTTRSSQMAANKSVGNQAVQKRKAEYETFAVKIIDTLPIKYREEQEHRQGIEQIIISLRKKPDGIYFPELMKLVDLPRHRVNDYCNALLHAKHVQKLNQRGLLYKLDPARYPATR